MRSALLAAAVLVPAITQAAVFTDESTFLSQIPPVYYLADFTGYTLDQTPPSYAVTENYGPKNGYSFQATAIGPSGSYWLYANPNALSVEDARDQLKITFTGAPVYWIGGDFWATDLDGNLAPNANCTITLSTGQLFPFTGSSFFGMSSATPIEWMIVDAVDIVPADPYDGTYYWPSIGKLYVGATPVPEPTILGILPLVGLMLSRRR